MNKLYDSILNHNTVYIRQIAEEDDTYKVNVYQNYLSISRYISLAIVFILFFLFL